MSLRSSRLKAGFPAVCITFLLSLATTARATPITSFLDASLTTGSLSGTNFGVSFSYDNSALTGTGQEFLSLLSFDFTLLGTHFTLADIGQGGQAVFQDGSLYLVTAAFFPGFMHPETNPPLDSIAFGFGGPGAIGYRDLSTNFGAGTYSISNAPEPSVFLTLVLGLSALLLLGRRPALPLH